MDLRDFSEYSNEEYNDYMLNREHPMCRCTPMVKIGVVFFTPCEIYLKQEYIEECKESVIWRN